MTEFAPRQYPRPDPVSQIAPLSRFSGQPIAIAATAFVILVLGSGSIAAWRFYTGTMPETDRVVATRQLQARTAQASEQLVEKTKGLEATQQESIDQLQVVQDQLQTVRRLLAAQQAGAGSVVVVDNPKRKLAEHLPADVRVAVQEHPRGTGDAVAAARAHIDPNATILVANGDVPLITAEALTALVEAHEASGAAATMARPRLPASRSASGSANNASERADSTAR